MSHRDNTFQVTFLIVGTQKSGTTALSRFLSKHPEICMAPRKESHLFDAPEFEDGWDRSEINRRYRSLFPNYHGQSCVGEATPIYMYLPQVPERIYYYNPAMKLILILRDPIDRAISHYHMERHRGNESLSLPLAFLMEPVRLARDRNPFARGSAHRRHSYIDRGFYARQIRRILKYFPRNQLLLLRNDQLREAHRETLRQVYRFIGVQQCDWFPEQELVFVGSQLDKPVPAWIRCWLRYRYAREMRELEELMNQLPGSWTTEDIRNLTIKF